MSSNGEEVALNSVTIKPTYVPDMLTFCETNSSVLLNYSNGENPWSCQLFCVNYVLCIMCVFLYVMHAVRSFLVVLGYFNSVKCLCFLC